MKRLTEDKLFSDLIRLRDGYCCVTCGKQYKKGDQGLHCSHYFGRANLRVRWWGANAISQCYGCHARFEGDPWAFTCHMQAHLQGGFNRLVALAYGDLEPVRQANRKDLRVVLRRQIEILQAIADQGLRNNLDSIGWHPGHRVRRKQKGLVDDQLEAGEQMALGGDSSRSADGIPRGKSKGSRRSSIYRVSKKQ